MSELKSVCVLLSSYNGEAFIERQINSILSQKNVNVKIIIRDDGSNDGTVKLIKKYLGEKVKLIEGRNVGWKKSFFELLIATKNESKFDYYAFSDQDDIWLDNKLNRAIEILKDKYSQEKCCLYTSNLECVDIDGNRLRFLYSTEEDYKQLDELYMLGFSPFGCSMVWNNTLNDIVVSNIPKVEASHDIWINLVARCQGDVYVDNNSNIQHIIHDSNACGVAKNNIERIKKFFRIYMSPGFVSCNKIVREYINIFGKDTIDKESLLWSVSEYHLSIKNKFRLLNKPEIKKLSAKKKIRIIFMALINRL